MSIEDLFILKIEYKLLNLECTINRAKDSRC